MPPVIALLTDFGLQDPYVGAMKGAILSVCAEATLVDLLHDVPAHDVAAGAPPFTVGAPTRCAAPGRELASAYAGEAPACYTLVRDKLRQTRGLSPE